MIRQALIYLKCLILCAVVSACSTPADDTPVNKTLVVTAGKNINPLNDHSNPVVIRLYQLSDRTEFDEAGFWDIFNGSEALNGIVVDKRSLSPIYPDEKRLVALDLEKDTNYLGVFAEYADYTQQVYHTSAPISADLLDSGVTVSIETTGVAIRFRNTDLTEDDPKPAKIGFFGKVKSLFGGD